MALQQCCARWLRRAFQLLLCLLGRVPVHVAFVMDGNRRYAERQHVDKATGHTHGYGKMVDVIHWCIELGVKYITVYAFSIDNFKRSPDEVAALMRLAEEKYIELVQDNGLAEREGIQMHIVGDLDLLPPAVQGAAARLMYGTARLRSRRATLNVCFSYTASEESVTAVHELQTAVRSGQLRPGDVTPDALTGGLRTGAACPPVDLLIRTSGETRLSDFLLWQAAHAQLCYLHTLWPDLSYWDFARCVMSYQRHAGSLAALRRRAALRLAATATAGCGRADDGGAGEEEGERQRPTPGDEGGTAAAGAGGCSEPEAGTTVRQRNRDACRQLLEAALTAHAEQTAPGRTAGGGARFETCTSERARGRQGSGDGQLPDGPSSETAAAAANAGVSSSSSGNSREEAVASGPWRSVGRQRYERWSEGGGSWRWWWSPLRWWFRSSSFGGGSGGGGIGLGLPWRWGFGGADDVPEALDRSGGSNNSSSSRSGGVYGGGAGGAGREVRLLRFFERLDQARLAWVATHTEL